jgi:hypothetical protein
MTTKRRAADHARAERQRELAASITSDHGGDALSATDKAVCRSLAGLLLASERVDLPHADRVKIADGIARLKGLLPDRPWPQRIEVEFVDESAPVPSADYQAEIATLRGERDRLLAETDRLHARNLELATIAERERVNAAAPALQNPVVQQNNPADIPAPPPPPPPARLDNVVDLRPVPDNCSPLLSPMPMRDHGVGVGFRRFDHPGTF